MAAALRGLWALWLCLPGWVLAQSYPYASPFGAAVMTSPASIASATLNNYSPASGAISGIWNLTSSVDVTLTGIAHCALGQMLTIRNGNAAGGKIFILNDQDTGSSAVNRFFLSAANNDGATNNMVLYPGTSFTVLGTGAGCIPLSNSAPFYVTQSLGDSLVAKWTGSNFLTFEGTAVQGTHPEDTQTVFIGNADITNISSFHGTATNQLLNLLNDATAKAQFTAGNDASEFMTCGINSTLANGHSYCGTTGSEIKVGTGNADPNHALEMDLNGNLTLRIESNTTSQTNGFVYGCPKVSGVPTGVPAVLTGDFSNALPMECNTANNHAYVYNSGWQDITASHSFLSYQPGALTAIAATKSVFYKAVKTSVVNNLIGSAFAFICTVNPTVSAFECGTDASCASPTTIGTVTVTASGQAFAGTVSNPAVTAGDYVAFALTAGTCTSLDVSATAELVTN